MNQLIITEEVFCGTKSFSKEAEEEGFLTKTIDNDSSHNPDLCIDFLILNPRNEVVGRVDIFWASPPCTGFSVASIGKHWNMDRTPKSPTSELGLKLLEKTIEWIAITKPKIWFIENPTGMMRTVIDPIFKKYNISDYRRVTVTYCQYGDTRRKSTDIWTNEKRWNPRPICKNGDKCHIAAPRGSRTGTQGLKGAKERGVIPSELFKEIFKTMGDFSSNEGVELTHNDIKTSLCSIHQNK